MARAHVLLIDDDEFIVRFVQMALEDLPIQLTCCHRLDDARQRVRAERFDLLICDQMLPDGQGLDFLTDLRAGGNAGATPADVQALMFSAGILGNQKQQALSLGVRGVLHKPVSIVELVAAVERALGAAPGSGAPEPDEHSRPSESMDVELANRHFAGNVALYRAFVATVREQAAQDLARGDQALAQKAWPEMRRLAHSLKTVFPMVGNDAAGQLSRELEHSATLGLAESEGLWLQVRVQLLRIAQQARVD